jgi:hypothetical protein
MIISDPLLDRTVFLIVGICLGLMLSWIHDARVDARSARNAIERLERMGHKYRHGRNEHGLTRLRRPALFIVIFLTGTAAVLGGQASIKQGKAADEIREAQRQISETQRCFGESLEDVLDALNKRTDLNSALNNADKESGEADQAATSAFVRLFAAVLQVPPVPEKRARKIFEDYQSALLVKQAKQDTYLSLLRDQQEKQRTNPFPSVEDYKSCLHKAGKKKKVNNGNDG